MIREIDGVFYLSTVDTEYIFRITEGGLLEHVYYGARLDCTDIVPFVDKLTYAPGNTIEYDDVNRKISLEHFKAELSENGKGDVREISFDMIHADDSRSCDFIYDSYEIIDSKYTLNGLPSAVGEGVQSLIIKLVDRNSGNFLTLMYATFDNSNVITRSVRFTNNEESPVVLRKIMSAQLDLDEFCDYDYVSFNGAWAYEMNMARRPIETGTVSNASYTLTSSSRANPFCMICERSANENYGEVYGFNLVYSGDHYNSASKDIFGKVRFMQGINPSEFSYTVESGDSFEAPEAVLSYSNAGFGKLSNNMHRFVRENIVRGNYQYKERPILINSWESFYFDINESKLLGLARDAKKLGVELFVIDDGWFKGRNDDTSSLGDWIVDEKKFPHGLKHFSDKIKELDMTLGIWIEPEMINEKSELYASHPDWAVRIPNKNHALGRNQMLLDLTREDVRDYIIDAIVKILKSADISYVKWDMNRVVSDAYGQELKCFKSLEFAHRYVLGLYDIMGRITKEFPEVLFEGCAAGGNRFDLGILCYMPQIWASDNTDANCRMKIQLGYSYGYPQSVIGAHVSQCPNHQTLRTTHLDSRFDIAAFGALGYECNLSDFSDFEREQMKSEIEFYKKYRKTMQFGSLYRLIDNGNDVVWFAFDESENKGVALYYQKESIPVKTYQRIRFKGLSEQDLYHFTSRAVQFSIKDFGSLVNSISPIHIRMNSFIHNLLDKFKHMDSEQEDMITTGKVLMNAGVKVKESFACRGYNENIRFMPDNGTRLYIIEKVAND